MSQFIADRIWPNPVIERSIFGTDDPDAIWRRVLEACPDAVECFAFEVSVGARFGLRLTDGSRIALKIHTDRSDDAYLEAVQRVQAHLVERGFPCPRPLGVRPGAALEEWCDEGEYRDAHEPNVRNVLAEHLAELHRLTGELEPPAGLDPFFPPADAPLWPRPHNVLFDFEATATGAEWIDEIARAAKTRRDQRPGALVIGHGDWSVKHFRFDGLTPTVIYDWDSLNTDVEAVFVGGAAASFTYTEQVPVQVWPSLSETQSFLKEYERARRTPFTTDERDAVRAAVVYSRAYSARCTHAVKGDATAMELREYAEALL